MDFSMLLELCAKDGTGTTNKATTIIRNIFFIIHFLLLLITRAAPPGGFSMRSLQQALCPSKNPNADALFLSKVKAMRRSSRNNRRKLAEKGVSKQMRGVLKETHLALSGRRRHTCRFKPNNVLRCIIRGAKREQVKEPTFSYNRKAIMGSEFDPIESARIERIVHKPSEWF